MLNAVVSKKVITTKMPEFGIAPRNPDDFTPHELKLIDEFNACLREVADRAQAQGVLLPKGLLNSSFGGESQWWVLSSAYGAQGTTVMCGSLATFLNSISKPLRPLGFTTVFADKHLEHAEHA